MLRVGGCVVWVEEVDVACGCLDKTAFGRPWVRGVRRSSLRTV